ncbi:MAG: hypothetical protein B7Z73_14750, partial [Planctomycetia bacterium 21-64-5]
NYHDIHKSLMFGKGPSWPAPIPVYARWSQHAMLLPMIEQQALYDSLDFRWPPATPGMAGVINFMPPYSNPNGINNLACTVRVPGFFCPSDGTQVNPNWPGQNNYAANQGSWLCDRLDEQDPNAIIAPGEAQSGIFGYLSHVRFAAILDGLSNTALFSEKIRGNGTPNPRSDMFIIPNQTSLLATWQACNAIVPATATPLTSKWGASWCMGENCCTQYNHVAVPNQFTCGGIGFPGTMSNMSMQVSPGSRHPGGVNLCMVDGSVRFESENVDVWTWRAIGTRAGEEALNLASQP